MSGKPKTIEEWRDAMRQLIVAEHMSSDVYLKFGLEQQSRVGYAARLGFEWALELAEEIPDKEAG